MTETSAVVGCCVEWIGIDGGRWRRSQCKKVFNFSGRGSMSRSSMKQNGTTKVTHIKNHIKNQHHQHSPSLAQHFQTLLSCLPHAVPSPPFSVFRHPSLCFFKGDHFATHPFTPKINGRFITSFLHFEKDFTIAHHLFRAPIRVCQSSHQRHRS